jgi:hypothetical protein
MYVKNLWRAADHPKKPVCTFIKIGGLTVPGHAAELIFFPPVGAAFLSLWPAAGPIFLRSGQRMPLILLRGG